MTQQLLISLIVFVSCSTHLKTQKIVKNNSEFLYGEISKEQLYFDYPVWLEQEEKYLPKKEIKEKILNFNEEVTVVVFLATWCGDSRRNVPRFFKSIKDNNHFKIAMWAVDRKKKMENNLTEKHNILRVPTFIFEQNGVEIGRIIENPKKSIEEDILDILQGNKNI